MARKLESPLPRHLIILSFLFIAFTLHPFPAFPQVRRGHELVSLPSVKDLNGATFTYSSLEDACTIFVFFSIYSDVSSELLLDYFGKFHNSDRFRVPVRVIGVNVDPSEEVVRERLEKLNIPFSVLLDLSLELSNRFGVKDMPTVFVVDRDGVVQMSAPKFSLDDAGEFERNLDSVLGIMPETTAIAAGEAADIDREYQTKKPVSDGAVDVQFCEVCESLLFYISSDYVLWTYDYRSGELEELATDVSYADWSPDGKAVVFSNHEKNGVWIKPLDSEAHKISPVGTRPAWSPNMDLVAFVVDENEIWVSRRSIGKRWRVAADGVEVDWSPDGTLLLVRDSRDRLWLVSPFARYSLLKSLFK